MGVNSLWKALDEAGCGTAVGIQEVCISDVPCLATGTQHAVNPWNVHRQTKQPQPKQNKKIFLAVDLSIWICESLSSVMAENHANPAIHLVFTRTVKLLSMGVGLVFVIEGKRRIRDAGITSNDEADKFRKRRAGTAFWKACKSCHDMLKLMGVTVVRAKAEGEALCALLNQRGIVDGVISNDGDSLLFGAKVVYTKFSIDNLENNRVVRYELDKLSAVVDAGDDSDVTSREVGRCNLSRYDLIAFALLTGSDLAGGGLDKVGHKKAVRFIRKCQLDNPMRTETAAIDELKSWARSVAPCSRDPFDEVPVVPPKAPGKCCSLCNHPGTKSHHLKHGCETCGTKPGEPCLESTTEDRFRKTLRAKALALFPKFDPSQVVEAYIRPNDNLLPVQFSSQNRPSTSNPDLASLMKMKEIVKGRSQETSREFVKTAIGRLLSRAELLEPHSGSTPTDSHNKGNYPARLINEKPIPLEITKITTVSGIPSYDVLWRVGATATDDAGNETGGYEYSTIEPQKLVRKRFPNIVEKFLEAEKERTKQGDGEMERRRAFLASLWVDVRVPDDQDGEKENAENRPVQNKRNKKRKVFFGDNTNRPCPTAVPQKQKGQTGGDDVLKLLRCVQGRQSFPELTGENSSIESSSKESPASSVSKKSLGVRKSLKAHDSPEPKREKEKSAFAISPLVCHFGAYLIPISPVDALIPGEYPPRHIFIRRDHEPTR